MDILKQEVLSETEQDQVATILSQPVIKKYFQALGISIISNVLAGSPGAGESDSEYIRKEAHYKGQLAVLETLYSIKPITKPQE